MIGAPNILFLGDVPDAMAAKTAFGIVDRRPERCINPVRFVDGSGRIADHVPALFPS